MRRQLTTIRSLVPGLLIPGLLLAAAPAWSARVLVPAGTIVYAQLDEKVTSDQGDFPIGYQPLGKVWRDVVVNGVTIIEAGTPIVLMVTDGTPRGIGARPGTLEIDAMYVGTVGGAEISLRGGYDQVAADSRAVNSVVSIAAIGVAQANRSYSSYNYFWLAALPAALLPGRKAVLDAGIVFDAQIPSDTYVDIPDTAVPTLNLRPPSGLTANVLPDEVSAASTQLPLAIQYCGEGWTEEMFIGKINDDSVRQIPVTVLSVTAQNDCMHARVSVELEELTEHFRRGINRFELTMGEFTEEVVLNIEI